MSLELTGYVNLPAHLNAGGFDHAAVHARLARLYVAHTANDAVDVIDCVQEQFLYTIPTLAKAAGALVAEADNLVFTSNRGENTVGIFSAESRDKVAKVTVGIRPNGLAYDPVRGLLLVAHVGDPAIPDSFTVAIVDVKQKMVTATVPMPGRTRWTVFDPDLDVFYVNIADPSVIVVVDARNTPHIKQTFAIPAQGPHGLDIDVENHRLFCACDDGKLVCVGTGSGTISKIANLSGAPDVIFFNPALKHLYVAMGDPGFIDIFDTRPMERIAVIETEKGAHTIAFDVARNKVYAFLPQTHRAAVYVDRG
jgi:DNA-binding beta-propeller fold protein YncE